VADFGDSDPEDAYDVDDPVDERFRVVRLWVASVVLEAARADHDHVRVLARIQAARWAVGLLRPNPPPSRALMLSVLAAWLDELLAAEGP